MSNSSPVTSNPRFMLPAALAAGGAAVLLIGWRRGRRQRARRFTLATYNMQGYKDRLNGLMEVIHDLDVDIIALQEVTETAAERIREEFGDDYPYMALHPHTGYDGQGVLSRYPIEESEYWKRDMGNQRVVIRIGRKTLTLFNVHPCTPLTASYAARETEITELLERANSTNGAMILAGDFNMEEWSEDYARIRSYYDDVYVRAGRGRGYTFPSSVGGIPILSWFARPMVRLDYIFCNEAIKPLKARVWRYSGGSDHRPVRARLLLK